MSTGSRNITVNLACYAELMKLDHSTLMLARDARSHYDAYEVLQEKTRELRRIQSNILLLHSGNKKRTSQFLFEKPFPLPLLDLNQRPSD